MGRGRNMKQKVRQTILILADLLSIGITYSVAVMLKFDGRIPMSNRNDIILIAGVNAVCLVLALRVYNGYRELHRPFLDIAAACVLAVITASVGAMAGAYIFRASAAPRSVVLGVLPLQVLLILAWRLVLAKSAKLEYYRKAVVLVSNKVSKTGLLESLRLPSYIQVKDLVSPESVLAQKEKYLGRSDELLYVLDDVQGDARRQLLEWAIQNKVDVLLVPDLFELFIRQGTLTRLGDTPILGLERLGLAIEYRAIKRSIDILGSMILLTVFSPLFVLVPLANRLFSPGPTYYKQERVGRGGKVFEVIKFRSMIPDAEKETGAVWASTKDDRITPVGRILRATRLDEVPQLLNVLKGEMSLVGPRPERPVFVKQFTERNPHFRLREVVKPGLTGLAQVMGRYDTDPDNKLRFDLIYIASYSVWLDLQILIWTVQTVLFPQKWIESPPKWVSRLEDYLLRG